MYQSISILLSLECLMTIITFNKDNEYIKLCKDFKEVIYRVWFIDINVALLSGNLSKNDYRISVLY